MCIFFFSLLICHFVESIWHTELDFIVPNRDRLVILSFTTSPYQNNSIQEENHIKQYHHRPMFIEDDDELAHTHLIEKFHSGSFDENDYFDTHEKLENEKTTSLITTPAPVTVPNTNANYDPNKIATKATNMLTNIETNDKQIYAENASVATNVNNRKQHARMRNRNNGTTSGRGTNRKSTNANRDRANDNTSASSRRDKNNRRTDDLRENFETKVNNKLDFDKNDGEFGERSGTTGSGSSGGGGNGKSSRKYATKIDTTDELPPDTEYEWSGNRKTTNSRDSNIHIVKPAEGSFVPSTPFSTDSKIIEIKPSTIRASKRIKRSIDETIETRMHIDSDRYEDEFADITDEDIREPRIYVNLENNEHYTENDDDNLLKPAPDTSANAGGGGGAAIAAALIDTSVPANVTAITTTTKQLHGFAGCLQHYLNVNKEIGRQFHWQNSINQTISRKINMLQARRKRFSRTPT